MIGGMGLALLSLGHELSSLQCVPTTQACAVPSALRRCDSLRGKKSLCQVAGWGRQSLISDQGTAGLHRLLETSEFSYKTVYVHVFLGSVERGLEMRGGSKDCPDPQKLKDYWEARKMRDTEDLEKTGRIPLFPVKVIILTPKRILDH